MSSIPIFFEDHQSPKAVQNLPTLPRFNRQFIGIGHHLEQKRKERKKIQQQQRAIANRVLFLQKEQERAQKNFNKKKTDYNKLVQTIDRNHHHKQQKQRLRQLKQMQLDLMRQENRHRRLLHRQIYKSTKFQLAKSKHNDYSNIKNFIKNKQQQKKEFLRQDFQNKREQWVSMNIEKQKGKQKVDKFYKKKNKQHTLNYLSMIEKQQMTKQQKLNTIKHLQLYQSALKKKLEQSTMKVSQIQQKIMKTSRTIQPRRLSSSLNSKNLGCSLRKQSYSKIEHQYSGKQSPKYSTIQKQDSFLSQKPGYFTQRHTQTDINNQQEIEQKINNNNFQEVQLSGFKIIRTTKRKKKNPQNRYKEYQFYY